MECGFLTNVAAFIKKMEYLKELSMKCIAL